MCRVRAWICPGETFFTVPMSRYDIIEEPEGQTYSLLLSALTSTGATASLTLRSSEGLSDAGLKLIESLGQLGLNRRMVSAWPGTELSGHTAELLEFPFAAATAHLVKSVSGLYDWLLPCLPEDLAVYASDGHVCLLSCAHERFSELRLADDEADSLLSRVPGLKVQRLPIAP